MNGRQPRVLITGASGFVGGHLSRLARERGADVVAIDRRELDLRDGERTLAAVERVAPDRIFHLAADASVRRAWSAPRATIENNVVTTVNVLEAVRERAPTARVLIAGSSEQYGPVAGERLPVGEDEPPRPQNPYAASKAAADVIAGAYADAHGLTVARMRAFNHAGPGQSTEYVVSSFAHQIALAERDGARRVTIVTGNTAPRRDFTDVRDVVRAYWLALERGAVGAFNVCSGEATSVADILAGLARHTALAVDQRTDPERLRRNEVMEIRGTHERLTERTGWEPAIPLDRTLADTLAWWRERAGAEVRARG